MPVTIRRATPTDLDALVTLWQELADFHADLGSAFALAPDAATHYRENLVRLMQDDQWRVLLAETGGVAVGFIAGAVRDMPPVFVEKKSGHISDALVTARFRRRGIGEQLYRAMVDWFRECRVTSIGLSAAAANSTALTFWRKLGFDDYMIRMRREL